MGRFRIGTTRRHPYVKWLAREDCAYRHVTFRYNASFLRRREHGRKAWLQSTVRIDNSDLKDEIKKADLFSAFSRYKLSMFAPNYTVFSNAQSSAEWTINTAYEASSKYVSSVEGPHNAIQLAIDGFFQYDEDLKYNAKPISGANADMSTNEIASYDPAFFFHHCFVDMIFWIWQNKGHRTRAESLDVIPGYAETTFKSKELDMKTELLPFKKSNGSTYISHDLTNIEDLGYVYRPSSLNSFQYRSIDVPDNPKKVISVKDINTADYSESFVIRLYATNASGKKFEMSREPFLSRWNVEDVSNNVRPQNIKAVFPISQPQLNAIKKNDGVDDLQYSIELEETSGVLPEPKSEKKPTIKVVRWMKTDYVFSFMLGHPNPIRDLVMRTCELCHDMHWNVLEKAEEMKGMRKTCKQYPRWGTLKSGLIEEIALFAVFMSCRSRYKWDAFMSIPRSSRARERRCCRHRRTMILPYRAVALIKWELWHFIRIVTLPSLLDRIQMRR